MFVAFELSEKTWKLGFTTGHGQKPRERTVTARQQERVLDEIAQAKRRMGLPETAPVVSCYEAGREGFWLHRFLQAHGITNHVVDSAAIEVNRRQRRAKSDGLDVRKLLSMLIRYHAGRTSGVAGGQGPHGRGGGPTPSAPGLGNLEAGAGQHHDPHQGVC